MQKVNIHLRIKKSENVNRYLSALFNVYNHKLEGSNKQLSALHNLILLTGKNYDELKNSGNHYSLKDIEFKEEEHPLDDSVTIITLSIETHRNSTPLMFKEILALFNELFKHYIKEEDIEYSCESSSGGAVSITSNDTLTKEIDLYTINLYSNGNWHNLNPGTEEETISKIEDFHNSLIGTNIHSVHSINYMLRNAGLGDWQVESVNDFIILFEEKTGKQYEAVKVQFKTFKEMLEG